MSCRETKALISSYLDGLLGEIQVQIIEQHIEICSPCRYKIELMQAIPQALQTERMLAPRPEFTALVMQKIVITTQLQNHTTIRSEIQTESRYTFRESSSGRGGQDDTPLSGNTTNSNASNIINFQGSSLAHSSSAKIPAVYVLRFSSLAAALVLAVGIGLYTLQFGGAAGGTANASLAVGFFAKTLGDAFESPSEVLLGVIIAGAVVTSLWFVFKDTYRDEERVSNQSSRERSQR